MLMHICVTGLRLLLFQVTTLVKFGLVGFFAQFFFLRSVTQDCIYPLPTHSNTAPPPHTGTLTHPGFIHFTSNKIQGLFKELLWAKIQISKASPKIFITIGNIKNRLNKIQAVCIIQKCFQVFQFFKIH
jgi:hypothetical protein